VANASGLAETAGPNALFCGLRSVLESDYGSLPVGRKRKRPQYYTPAWKAGIDDSDGCLLTVKDEEQQRHCLDFT